MPLPPPQVPPLAYRPEEAAHALGLSRSTVYNLLRDGRLRAVKVGRATLVTAAECERFLSSLEAV